MNQLASKTTQSEGQPSLQEVLAAATLLTSQSLAPDPVLSRHVHRVPGFCGLSAHPSRQLQE